MTEQQRTSKTVDDFHVGQHVRYIPNHAHGDPAHEDCENGVVTSLRPDTGIVFVRFKGPTGEACDPRNLR